MACPGIKGIPEELRQRLPAAERARLPRWRHSPSAIRRQSHAPVTEGHGTHIRVREIAEVLGASLEGESGVSITAIGAIETAPPGTITFCASAEYQKFLATTKASCVIVAREATVPRSDICVMRVPDPFAAFTRLQRFFAETSPAPFPPGIHPTALIPGTAQIGANAAMVPYVTIGERAVIGENAVIYPRVTIGNDVAIGAQCLLYPGVSVYHRCIIGARAIIHAGAVIGSDGFGFAPKDGG